MSLKQSEKREINFISPKIEKLHNFIGPKPYLRSNTKPPVNVFCVMYSVVEEEMLDKEITKSSKKELRLPQWTLKQVLHIFNCSFSYFFDIETEILYSNNLFFDYHM